MALNKSSTPGVLPHHSNRGAFEQERAEGENLAKTPVDRPLTRHVDALLESDLELGVDGESRWRVIVSIPNSRDNFYRNPGRLWLASKFFAYRALDAWLNLRGAVGVDGSHGACLCRVGFGKRSLETILEVAVGGFVLFFGDVAATDEGLGVQGSHRALRLNEVVHQRLSHRGVIALVVAAPTVAHEVDDDVSLEFLTVGKSQLGDSGYSLRVITVDVKDRRLNGFGDIGRVDRGATLAGRSGESDLVVDDEVDGSAGAVRPQLRHLQNLNDDSLTGHRGVAVNHHRQDGERAYWLPILFCPDNTFEYSVDRLKMRRIRCEVDRNGLALGRGERALSAKVVLDVAGALDGARVLGSLKLPENLTVGLAGDVGENIEATAMGHTDSDLIEPGFGRVVKEGVQHRDG